LDRNLIAFIAIAETGNVTNAAAKIGLAQSSLTKKLSQIETEYGGRLFERLPRGVALTPLGEALYNHAKNIERTYVQAREEIAALKSGHLASLRVGAGPVFHLLYISRVFDRLRQEFPKTDLVLKADVNEHTLPSLLNGTLDLVAGRIEPFEGTEKLFTRSLTTVEDGIVMGLGHALERVPCLTADDLAAYPWITYGNSKRSSEELASYFHAHGLKPPAIAMHSSSFATALQLVALGDYLMTIPSQLGAIAARAGARIRLLDDPIHRFRSGIYARPSTLRFPVVRRFIEILEETIEEGSELDPEDETGRRAEQMA
jgi:DNA-binding transcriptional LysR family regulator